VPLVPARHRAVGITCQITGIPPTSAVMQCGLAALGGDGPDPKSINRRVLVSFVRAVRHGASRHVKYVRLS
jgi:hypothetical protein